MFAVTDIINGDEIIIQPGWHWQGIEGNHVVVYGYQTPTVGMPGYEFAKSKLEALLRGKNIELFNPMFSKRYGEGKLVCSVYLDGVDIANYFPEFKSNKIFYPQPRNKPHWGY